MLDVLVAGGDLSAPTGYTSSVATGVMPGHYIDSDTYGYQAGLKATLTRQMEGEKVTPELWKDMQIGKRFLKDALGRDSGTDAMFDARVSEGERAINAFNASQQSLPALDESVEARIAGDEAAGLFDVNERSVASTLSGKELNKWLRQGGVLKANTPSGIPGQPSEFRGITGTDVPSRTRQAINTMRNVLPRVGGTSLGALAGAAFLPPYRAAGDPSDYVGDPAIADALQSALKAREETGELKFDLEMETEITPEASPAQYLRSVEQAGETGKQIIPRNFPFIGSPSKEFMPEYLESTGPEPEYGSSVWHTDPAFEEAITHQYNPAEFGLDPFTTEQVGASSNFLANLLAEGTEAQKTAIQRALSPATAGILRENLAAHFARDDADSPFITDPSTGDPFQLAQVLKAPQARELGPTPSKTEWFGRRSDDVRFPYPETGFQGIPEFYSEPAIAPATFIGDEGFTPSLSGYTLGGPVVGEEEQPMAQAVTQALANTGQPVQQNLQALAALAQTDPSIAERYIPGSQALQDITTQVESFSEPTVEWTPHPPEVPDITETLVDFSAIQSAQENAAQKAQDKIDRGLRHAANVRKKDENKARLAEARDKKAEQRKIDKENREMKAEEKRIADKQAAEEKQRRADDIKFSNMLKQANENHRAYLARKKEEEDRRKRLGYGVGAMFT
jgi:hypothetical protein